MKNAEYKKLLSRYGFFTYKNLRKTNKAEIEWQYRKNCGSMLKGDSDGYSYIIVWKLKGGINSFVFKGERLLSCKFSFYCSPNDMRKCTLKYIRKISTNIENYEHSKVSSGNKKDCPGKEESY